MKRIILSATVLVLAVFTSSAQQQGTHDPRLKNGGEINAEGEFIAPSEQEFRANQRTKQQGERLKGFFKPYGPAFKLSTAVFWGGAIADVNSARGRYNEANPLVRNRDGSASMGKSLALTGAVFVPTLFLEKKNPKAAFWVRMIAGAVRFGVAWHNSRIPK